MGVKIKLNFMLILNTQTCLFDKNSHRKALAEKQLTAVSLKFRGIGTLHILGTFVTKCKFTFLKSA
jgi:hypothetical protein